MSNPYVLVPYDQNAFRGVARQQWCVLVVMRGIVLPTGPDKGDGTYADEEMQKVFELQIANPKISWLVGSFERNREALTEFQIQTNECPCYLGFINQSCVFRLATTSGTTDLGTVSISTNTPIQIGISKPISWKTQNIPDKDYIQGVCHGAFNKGIPSFTTDLFLGGTNTPSMMDF